MYYILSHILEHTFCILKFTVNLNSRKKVNSPSTCMEVGIEGTEKNKSLSELLLVILFNPKTAIIQPTSLLLLNAAHQRSSKHQC